jgi:hypothetical protein
MSGWKVASTRKMPGPKLKMEIPFREMAIIAVNWGGLELPEVG